MDEHYFAESIQATVMASAIINLVKTRKVIAIMGVPLVTNGKIEIEFVLFGVESPEEQTEVLDILRNIGCDPKEKQLSIRYLMTIKDTAQNRKFCEDLMMPETNQGGRL